LREELSKQKKLVEEKTEELKVKKAALEEINSKIRELQALSEEKIKTKNMLTAKIKECELKLDRA
jgi:dynein heavy chain